jgi:hypothetical protein
MPDKMPVNELVPSNWTEAERADFTRKRRNRNILLLIALGGFCVLIYVIALVKLHEYGRMW